MTSDSPAPRLTAEQLAHIRANAVHPDVCTHLARDVPALIDEVERLRGALEGLMSWRSRNEWRPDRTFPTDAARHWHDGHITALSSMWLRCNEALHPAEHAEQEATWQLSFAGTDLEWYEHTGHCGGCGLVFDRCECAGECGCWDAHGPPPERDPSPMESRALRAEAEVERLRAERQSVIDAVNLYGSWQLHRVLDDIGFAPRAGADGGDR